VQSSMVSSPVNRRLCRRNSGEPSSIGSNPVRRPDLVVVLRFAWSLRGRPRRRPVFLRGIGQGPGECPFEVM
jgi:hypothetical protein